MKFLSLPVVLCLYVSAVLAAPAPPGTVVAFMPASPLAFEPIHARVQLEHICEAPEAVELLDHKIVIRIGGTICSLPFLCFDRAECYGEIALGRFPPGIYRVEVMREGQLVAQPDPATFVVGKRHSSAPTIDASGIWWDPASAGSAIVVEDVASTTGSLRIMIWNTFDEKREPIFYFATLDGFSQGDLRRVRGTAFGSAPSQAEVETVGKASISLYTHDQLVFGYLLGTGGPMQYRTLRRLR